MSTTTDIFLFRVDETVHCLRDSLRTLEWAVVQVPERLLRITPEPVRLFEPGSWSVAVNLAHLAVYDERIGLPVIESLANGGDGRGAIASYGENWLTNDALALSEEPTDAIMARLRTARERQIELAQTFSDEQFNTPVTPFWRERAGTTHKSPGWVLSKTFQHTWEHGNGILRVLLFAIR